MFNSVFFLSGFIAVCAQTFLLREIQVVFHGNELSIGLVISLWMLGVAAGSILTAKFVKNRGAEHLKRNSDTDVPCRGAEHFKHNNTDVPCRGTEECRGILALTFLAAGPYLMLSMFFIREIRNIFGFLAGIELPLLFLLWVSASIFIPAGALIGAQFSLGMGWLKEREGLLKSGRIYLWETLGFFAGGVVYTLSLLLNANSVFVATAILQISSLAVIPIIEEKKQKIMLAVFAAAFIPVLLFSNKIETTSLSRLFAGYKVVEAQNTQYGRLAAVSRGGEKFFFSDGNPIETFNAPNKEAAENNVFLPLLFHAKPESVLLIGGTGRYITTIQAYGIQSLDYVEINPWLIDFVSRNSATPLFGKEGSKAPWGPRPFSEKGGGVNVFYEDGRKYIEGSGKSYDAVFVDAPYPAALSVNRYYTLEFFDSVNRRLAPGGIFVISLPGSMNYVDRYLGGMNAAVLSGLNGSFKHVRVIPGERNIFICGNSPAPRTATAVERFKDLKIEKLFVSAKYIKYKLDPAKEKWFLNEMKKHEGGFFGKQPVNRDFSPRGLFKSLIYRQSIFSSGRANLYSALSKYIWIAVILTMILLFTRRGYSGTAFTSGAAAMGMQMVSIWGMQVLNGAVYYWIGLLSACFMAGTGIAAYAAINNYQLAITNSPKKIIRIIDILFVIWIIIWFCLLSFVKIPWHLLFLLSAGSGALLGFQFPALAPAEGEIKKTGEHAEAGKIYAADLMGGWLAALIGGTVIIPAWGLPGMVIMLLALKIASMFRAGSLAR
ncbi:MAG: hypothetical protein ABII64_04810 [Elusimicrobiota bacterium]